MEKKVAILRGINVGGKKRILMADLKLIFEKLGFSNITTYIQSGNVAFKSKKRSCPSLAKSIGERIAAEFKFEVPIQVLTAEALKAAM